MKRIALFTGLVVVWLLVGLAVAQPGLKGEYYTGTNFGRKVMTRIDPQIRFDWSARDPAPGIPYSYYSIRWTGKLLAPATGQYRFYAKVDDGIRIWVGNQKVMDSWQLNDSQNYTGSIVLEAGRYYDLRVDYFNDMLGGVIELYWQRPDAKKTSGDLITAQSFFQKAPPAALPKQSTPAAAPPVTASIRPKVLPRKPPIATERKSIPDPLPSPKTAPGTTLTASPIPIRKPTIEPSSDINIGTTFVLRNVQFEQSSYVLLAESSTELDKLVLAMKNNPLRRIDVAGHTDNVGDPRLNLSLSENRAKVVAAYLVRRGIADGRITTTGYGGTRPVADNSRESERAKNRRVEVTIR